MDEEVTEKTLQALKTLDGNVMTAQDFGKKMWKESPALEKSYNIGNGAHRGVGLWLSAGSYLAKLCRRGLVRRDLNHLNFFMLTGEGRRVLEKKKLKLFISKKSGRSYFR